MRYALKLIWHGTILLGRVGWIVGAAIASFVIPMLFSRGESENESEIEPFVPAYTDVNHPAWHAYWGDK